MKKILSVSFLFLFFALGSFAYQVVPEDNMISKKLFGKWKTNSALTKRLLNKERVLQVEFQKDDKVVEQIPEKYEKFLKDRQIFTAGWMLIKGKKHPFVYISYQGAPFIVYFRPRNGDPLGDAESLHIMLAAARDTENDILFIGGDFSREPFIAFDREKEVQKESH